MTDLPRILALVGDESSPVMWRIWQPFAELQKHGVKAHWKHKADPELLDESFLGKLPSHYDAILLPRLSWTDRIAALFFLGPLRKAGLRILLEVDDDVYSAGIVDRQFAVFERERIKGREALERAREDRLWLLQHVDGITVSSRRLQTVVQQYTSKPVEVVPNAIDLAWFHERTHGVTRAIPPLTIGWAGGARYDEDLAPIAEAWARLARKYPQLVFVTQGHIAERLTRDVPEAQCRYLAWRSLEDYPSGLLNIDIGCCSVAPKLFNSAKTPIKLWEYTAAGAACVVSPTLYGPYVTDGEDGLVAETANDWTAALEVLVLNADLRRRLFRTQRRRMAEHHSLAQQWWRWPAAWQTILEQSPAILPSPLALTRV